MTFREFMRDLPIDTTLLIRKAFSIFELIRDLPLKYYEEVIKFNYLISKENKKYISLILSMLLQEGTLKDTFNLNGVSYKKVLDIFKIKSELIEKLSFLSLEECEKYFKEFYEILESELMLDNTEKCVPELLANSLLYDNYEMEYILESLELLSSDDDIKDLKLFSDIEEQLESKIIKNIPEVEEYIEDNEQDSAVDYYIVYPEEDDLLEVNNKAILNFGELLTSRDYDVYPAIGRERELEALVYALATTNTSVVLVGDPGTGKTAIAEGFAYLIKNKLTYPYFQDYKLFGTRGSTLVEGTKYVGTLEERMNKFLKLLKEEGKVILFIDEIHEIIGAGAGEKSNINIAGILKPFLSSGKVKLVGATTKEEYDKYLKSDGAFNRRLKLINVKEPNEKALFNILRGTITKNEKESNVKFDFTEREIEAILGIIISATADKNRIYNDKEYNPHLAVSILNEAFTPAKLLMQEKVELEHIANAILSAEKIYEDVRKRYAKLVISIKERETVEQTNIIPFNRGISKKMIKR